MGIFGPFRDGSDCEAALLAHLQAWMPTYIPAVRRFKDPEASIWPDGVEGIGAYAVRHFAAENWPEDHLPCLIAHSPGMADEPSQEGEGTVNARYVVTLIAVAEGADEAESKLLTRLYASAARAAIMQHPGLGAFAAGIAMGREAVYPVRKGVEAERNLLAIEVPYVIEVANILDVSGGPLEPLEDPETEPENWPTVKEGGGSAEVDPVAALKEGGFFES